MKKEGYTARKTFVFPLLFTSLILLFSGCINGGNQSSAEQWQAWVTKLTGNGYTVTNGSAFLVDSAGCTNFINVFGTCWGNNPAAPYIVPLPPVDNSYINPIYGTPFNTITTNGNTVNLFYRLADTDALVTVVSLPPRAAYMGYQSYIFTRETSSYPFPALPANATPDPARVQIFGSVGNNINSASLASQNSMNWGNGAAVFITTPNQTLASALITNAIQSGMNSNNIFVEPLGSQLVTGRDALADDFISLIRYALPENTTAADAWRSAVAQNVRVYRVSLPTIAAQPYPQPAYTTRQSLDESGYQPALNELSTLLSNWLATQQLQAVTITDMIPSVQVDPAGNLQGLVGSLCLTNGTSCLGDNQDTDSYRFGVIGLLAGNKTSIIAGVNHTVTNAATYISLAINDQTTVKGVASLSQTNPGAAGFSSGSLTGSAATALTDLGLINSASPNLIANLPNLYVAFVSRNCTPGQTYCAQVNTADVPLLNPISIIQRAYLKPGSTAGANPNLLLTPKIIQ
ncbi:MAG: hypothetical protein HQM07_03990 [Zetaproteobacteria bacterium]|nr:hypothetical protein [Zetaproteobacteria bacterium]